MLKLYLLRDLSLGFWIQDFNPEEDIMRHDSRGIPISTTKFGLSSTSDSQVLMDTWV